MPTSPLICPCMLGTARIISLRVCESVVDDCRFDWMFLARTPSGGVIVTVNTAPMDVVTSTCEGDISLPASIATASLTAVTNGSMMGKKSTFSGVNVKTIWPSGRSITIGPGPAYGLFLFRQISPFAVSQHVHEATLFKRT